MTEPREIAEQAEETVAGLYHWRIHNANIDGAISSTTPWSTATPAFRRSGAARRGRPGRPAHAERRGADRALHQRAAWRYRREPRLRSGRRPTRARRREAPPPLRRGIYAARRPRRGARRGQSGRTTRSCAPPIRRCCFAPTSSRTPGGGELHFIPPEYHEDPAETRRSVGAAPRAAFRGALLRSRRAVARRSQGGATRSAGVLVAAEQGIGTC